MSQETRLRKWLVIAASVIAVGGGLWLLMWWMGNLSKAVVPGTQIGHTTSMESVDLSVTDSTSGRSLNLRVPKAYLVLRENWKGGSQYAIWMEAALPEMRPARAIPKLVGSPGSPEHERALSAMNNGVWLRLESKRRDIAEGLENTRRYLSNAERVLGAPRAYEAMADTRYGLQRYREKRCWLSPEPQAGVDATSKEHCVDNLTDHYVVASDDLHPVYIVCDLTDVAYLGPRVGCDATAEFRGFALTYRFKESQLGRWREFDEAVRKLLSALVLASGSSS